MIDEMVRDVERTIASSKEGNSFVAKGRELSVSTGNVFQQIENATVLMNDAMNDVSTNIKEVRSMTDIVSAESKVCKILPCKRQQKPNRLVLQLRNSYPPMQKFPYMHRRWQVLRIDC